MEIASLGEVFEYMSIQRHESPEQNGHLLIERYDVQALWQIGGIRVDDVLEVFGEAFVEWVQVHPAVDDSEKPEEFVGGEVLDDLVLELLVHVKLALAGSWWVGLHCSWLHHEVSEDLVERDVAASDQEVQVVAAWWLVLYQDKQKMDSEGD